MLRQEFNDQKKRVEFMDFHCSVSYRLVAVITIVKENAPVGGFSKAVKFRTSIDLQPSCWENGRIIGYAGISWSG